MINENIVSYVVPKGFLLDEEMPKITFDTLAHILHVETSKKYMDIPIKKEMMEDKDFFYLAWVKDVWNNHWKGDKASTIGTVAASGASELQRTSNKQNKTEQV